MEGRRKPKASGEGTVSVLNAAISRFVESANTGQPAQSRATGKEFIPSSKFEGAKPGYFFSTGSSGLGYYLDHKVAPQKEPKGSTVKPEAKKAKALDADELLKEAENQAKAQEVLDAKGLRRLVWSFERKYKDNLEQRMKYAEQPEKFMNSEVALDESVENFLQLVNSPDLYPEFIESNVLPHLLNLLTHDNADIAIDVIDLLQALTDTEDNEEWASELTALVSALVENNAFELLVQRLQQLDENVDEEASAVFNVLAVVENMIDVVPSVAPAIVEKTRLLRWMLMRLRPREFDSIKQYVAEILAELLQGGEANQKKMGEMGGIDSLLQGIAPFKSRDPQTEDEAEFLENLFDSLCSCLLLPENKTKFVESEGMELMILILKQKRVARRGAIKVLEFATTQCPAACDRFVDVLGLKTLFALFMGKSKLKAGKERSSASQAEEMLVTMIANLFQEIMKGSRRDRVAAKFVENEFEKCDRLIEVYFSYHVRLMAEEERLKASGDAIDEEEVLVERLNAGLATIQQCCLIIAHLWSIGDVALRQRLLTLLHQKSHTLEEVRSVLKEMIEMIGGEGLEREQQQQRLEKLLQNLGPQSNESQSQQVSAPKLPEDAQPSTSVATGTENGHVSKKSAQTQTSSKQSESGRAKEREKEKEKERDSERDRRRQRDRDRDRDRGKTHKRDYHRDKKRRDRDDEKYERKRERRE